MSVDKEDEMLLSVGVKEDPMLQGSPDQVAERQGAVASLGFASSHSSTHAAQDGAEAFSAGVAASLDQTGAGFLAP